MRIQAMHSVKKQIFLISGRFMCFILIIASVFHFGQSISSDNPSAYVQEGTSQVIIHETERSTDAGKNYNSGNSIIAGQEYIYIAEGASFYGIDEKSVNKITKRKASSPQPEKSIAKKEPARKKAITHKPVLHPEPITCLPGHSNIHLNSLSGQAVCVAPGSHDRNFIFFQYVRYHSTGYFDGYIDPNYHYLFSTYSKTNRNGGGIRPPPFPC